MAKYLVIVESPTKVKTIKKFLGSNYEVAASNGHVRDLPKSQLGVDVENDYEPKYITIRGKGDILASLRKSAKKADKVYLATDPDREGEAISWHLSKALKLDESKMNRITFNEITKNAVKDSLKHARDIDMNLVNAQRAKYGLTALEMGDDALTAAAQTRAEEISVVNSHVRPDGSKCFTVLKDYGVTDTPTGENAAWGSVSPEEVVNAWMNSEGHRANILNPEARKMSVGYYYNSNSTWGHQWIQIFTK